MRLILPCDDQHESFDEKGFSDQSRLRRLEEVIADCRARRRAGESLSDEQVIAANYNLMPDLGTQLRLLGLIDVARAQVEKPFEDQHAMDGIGSPIAEDDTKDLPDGLRIRCPHCRTPFGVQAETPFTSINCHSCGIGFSLIQDTPDTLPFGEQKKLAHFELIEQVGIGGFGTVYKARDIELDRVVAIKIPRRNCLSSEEMDQFLREARAAAQLSHPNIVRVLEVGREGDNFYIAADFVHGVSLANWLNSQRPTPHESAALCRKIASALEHAHQAGVIHRDLKPHNVMIDENAEPYLMDFGLARREVGEVTVTVLGQVMGTPAYMSPEQARGESHHADRRTDVYSLGVVLFELLTGELPFRGNSQMLMHHVIHSEPTSPRKLNHRIPRDLETVCLKCLEKDPRRRYGTARELADELDRFARGNPIHARPIGAMSRVWRTCKRNPLPSALLASLVAVLLIGIGLVSLEANRANLAVKGESTARQHAIDEAELRRKQLYRSDIIAAQQAWEDNNIESVLALLKRHVPGTGQQDLRGFEWYYLWNLCTPSLSAKTIRLNGPVGALAFSPDDTTLATGTGELWNLQSLSKISKLKVYQNLITDLSFSPNGRFLAAGSHEGTFSLWNLDQGEGPSMLGRKHPTGDSCLAFSPDGRYLATEDPSSGNSDDPPTSSINLWDVNELVVKRSISKLPSGLRCIKFSPCGTKLAMAGFFDIGIWDESTATYYPLDRPVSMDGIEVEVAFSNDGKTLATAGRDNVIKLWDTTSRKRRGVELRGHTKSISGIAFSRNDQRLISASWDGTIKIWDLSTFGLWTTLKGHSGAILYMACSHNGKMLATVSADGQVRLWKLPTDKAPEVFAGSRGTFLTSDQTLVTQTGPSSLTLWDISTGEKKGTYTSDGGRFSTCTLDGKTVATGFDNGTIEVKDVATNKTRRISNAHDGDVDFLLFCPRGTTLVSASGSSLRLWNVTSLEQRADLVTHRGYQPPSAYAVAFSPDGSVLAGATKKPNERNIAIKVWDLDGREIAVLKESANPILSLAFSNNGRLAAGGFDGSISIWKLGEGNPLLNRWHGHTHIIYSLAFSPDNSRLASASTDRTVKLWDPENWHEMISFQLNSRVYSVDFSPDGYVVATGGGNVQLWRAATAANVVATNW